MNSNTHTGEAIEMMTGTLFDDAHGARPREDLVPRVAVVMTDGISNGPKDVQEASDAARAKGIKMFAIGIGPSVIIKELDQIANQPSDSYRFSVIDFDKIDTVVYFVQNEALQGTETKKLYDFQHREKYCGYNVAG